MYWPGWCGLQIQSWACSRWCQHEEASTSAWRSLSGCYWLPSPGGHPHLKESKLCLHLFTDFYITSQQSWSLICSACKLEHSSTSRFLWCCSLRFWHTYSYSYNEEIWQTAWFLLAFPICISLTNHLKHQGNNTCDKLCCSGCTLGQVPHSIDLHSVVCGWCQRVHLKLHHVSWHTFHDWSHWETQSTETKSNLKDKHQQRKYSAFICQLEH